LDFGLRGVVSEMRRRRKRIKKDKEEKTA